jgi:hypothetical protein
MMARLDFNDDEAALRARADELEGEAKQLRDQAYASKIAREKTRPLVERLVFAAYTRCQCGAGVAYDPTGEVHSPQVNPGPPPCIGGSWECSDILLYYGGALSDEEKARSIAATHDSAFPFAFYEIKSEDQPSANGATTRERATARTA